MTDSPPKSSDTRPGLKPPQFGLKTLFWLVALLCGVLATLQWSPLIGAAVLLLGAAVFAHVAGNALGSRLRANGNRSRINDR